MTFTQIRFTIVAFLACCACLLSLSSWALAITNEKPIPAQDSPVIPSPFDATGLTARPGETAEEILLRAHNYDPGAVAMASIGYAKGIGGFPKDHNLAAAWAGLASNMNMQSVSALSNLVINEETGETSSDRLCGEAQHSPFVPLFKQAGILDVERLCVTTVPEGDWLKDLYAWSAAQNKRIIELLRTGAERRLSSEEYQKLFGSTADCVTKPPLLFYAATTHDWESETPDWRLERMLSFFSNTHCADDKIETAATLLLLQYFNTEPEAVLELFRKAHQGDPAAIRTMAMNYYTGEQGFPCMKFLSERWTTISAWRGDPRAMEMMAAFAIGDASDGAAVWLVAAGEFGSERAKSLSVDVMQAASKLFPHTVDELQKRGMALAERIRKRMAESGQQQNTTVQQQGTGEQ